MEQLPTQSEPGCDSPRAGQSAASSRDIRVGTDQLLALVDHTSAVIYMRDLGGRYMLVNRQYERLFQVRREEIIGLTDHDLFPAEVADEFFANDQQAARSTGPVQMEEAVPGDDGPHTYITVKFPLFDEAGQAYAVCGISTDITDRKRAEEKVVQLNADLERRVLERTAELEASTRELDAFAYSVSHDLRAPLRSLSGFSQLLLEDYGTQLDETGVAYLNRLQENSARMARLIDDLLSLSRTTRLELRRQPMDLGELAGQIVRELEEGDPARKVATAIGESLVAVGDPHLMRLALYNLISNAWKFTAQKPDASIEMGYSDSGPDRVFFIRDNGAGFDPRFSGKLFQPFQRLHSPTEFEGSGIGLAIVQRVIERHGGSIWAESIPQHGATFFFTVNTRSAHAEIAESSAISETEGSHAH